MLLEQGKSSKEVMLQSLDEFGRLDEFAEMDNIIGGMLARSEENKQETHKD